MPVVILNIDQLKHNSSVFFRLYMTKQKYVFSPPILYQRIVVIATHWDLKKQ